jgi:hypothetical protein
MRSTRFVRKLILQYEERRLKRTEFKTLKAERLFRVDIYTELGNLVPSATSADPRITISCHGAVGLLTSD